MQPRLWQSIPLNRPCNRVREFMLAKLFTSYLWAMPMIQRLIPSTVWLFLFTFIFASYAQTQFKLPLDAMLHIFCTSNVMQQHSASECRHLKGGGICDIVFSLSPSCLSLTNPLLHTTPPLGDWIDLLCVFLLVDADHFMPSGYLLLKGRKKNEKRKTENLHIISM